MNRSVAMALFLGLVWSGSAAAQDKDVDEGGSTLPEGTTTEKLMALQAPLLDAADALRSAAFEESGYGAIEIDIVRGVVQLYWKASERVSDPVQRTIDEAGRSGVVIEVIPSPFSNSELMNEVRVLADELLSSGRTLVSIGPIRAHGLRLAVPPDDVSNTEQSPPVKSAKGRLSDTASGGGDVGVVVEASAPVVFAAREADTPPWWGGAVVLPAVGASCSSGFAVGNFFGKYMLSSAHCFTGNGVLATSGAGLVMGISELLDPELDIGRIRVGSVAGRIWDGPAGPGAYQKPVVGWGANFPGQLVCTSGGLSGARCDIQIVDVQQFIFPDGMLVLDMVRARHLCGENAAGQGDSGGPVFTLTSTLDKVKARGIISSLGANFETACTGAQGRFCSSEVFFAEVGAAMRELDVWIELTP